MTDRSRVTLRSALAGLSALLIALLCLGGCAESITPDDTNNPPRIVEFGLSYRDTVLDTTRMIPDLSGIIDTVAWKDSLFAYAMAVDDDGDSLTYQWWATSGRLPDSTSNYSVWRSSSTLDSVRIGVTVSDSWDAVSRSQTLAFTFPNGGGGGGDDDDDDDDDPNQRPQIIAMNLYPDPSNVVVGDTVLVECVATDPDGPDSQLSYQWTSQGGELLDFEGEDVRWVAPETSGSYRASVVVADTSKSSNASITITVKEKPFVMDFSTDQVNGFWTFAGYLSGLGGGQDDVISQSLEWNSTLEVMEFSSNQNYAYPVYRLNSPTFDDVIIDIDFERESPVANSYGFIGMVPKFVSPGTYFMFGYDFYIGQATVIYAVNGELTYPSIDRYPDINDGNQHHLTYEQTGEVLRCYIDGVQVYQGPIQPAFEGSIPMGLSVYGIQNPPPVFWDNLTVQTN